MGRAAHDAQVRHSLAAIRGREIERRSNVIGGIAVHLASRVLSRTDLLVGSGIGFEDRCGNAPAPRDEKFLSDMDRRGVAC